MSLELISLQNSLLLQLKEASTSAYQRFLNAYELMKKKDEKAAKEYEIICNSNRFLLDSLDFYLVKFIDLDNSELFLYIFQLLSLSVKSFHNLHVIYRNAHMDKLANKNLTLEVLNKGEIYFYNLLLDMFVVKEQVKDILMTFVNDADIGEDNKEIGNIFLLDFVNRHKLSHIYFSNHEKSQFESIISNLDKHKEIDNSDFQLIISRLKELN